MPRKASQPKAASPAATPGGRPSALVDTRIIYCGDCLDQLPKLPDGCVDLIYIDPPFNSNRNYEVFWGEAKEKRAFEDRHASTAAYIDYIGSGRVRWQPTAPYVSRVGWHGSGSSPSRRTAGRSRPVRAILGSRVRQRASPQARLWRTHATDTATIPRQTHYMRPRCVELARVLKKTGSVYCRCDWHASRSVKVMLGHHSVDLGRHLFRRETQVAPLERRTRVGYTGTHA